MKFDEELALIAKRELALSIIHSSKNHFQCKDRLKGINAKGELNLFEMED